MEKEQDDWGDGGLEKKAGVSEANAGNVGIVGDPLKLSTLMPRANRERKKKAWIMKPDEGIPIKVSSSSEIMDTIERIAGMSTEIAEIAMMIKQPSVVPELRKERGEFSTPPDLSGRIMSGLREIESILGTALDSLKGFVG